MSWDVCARIFELESLPAIGRNAPVYIGTEKSDRPIRGGPPRVVFVRAISHSSGLVTDSGATRALQQGLDELERAQANSKVNLQSSSRIFLHSLHELDPKKIAARFNTNMLTLKTILAARLLKLRVYEIDVKVRLVDEDGIVNNLQLFGSSMEGTWLQPNVFLERPNPWT